MASSSIRNYIIFAIKLALAVTFLGLIFHYIDIREIVIQIRSAAIEYVMLAVLFQVIAKGAWTIRWQEILKLNGIYRNFWVLFGLVHIGLFFNNFLPSSIGGDAIRGYYTSGPHDRITKSYGAVLVERVVGIVSLAFMSAAAISYIALRGEWQFSDFSLLVGGIGSVVLVATGLSLLLWDGWRRLLSSLAKFVPYFARILDDLSASLEIFRRSDRVGISLVVISSIALQVVAVCFYLACARSLGITTPTVMFFIIIPISVVISMLPISLNGLGVREAALVTMFVTQGAPVAPVGGFVLLALAISTAFSLAGGVLYIFWRPVRAESS